MILFYQKRYDHVTARFEDLLPDLEPPAEGEHSFCSTCARDSLMKQSKIPQVFEKLKEKCNDEKDEYGMVKYLNEEFRVGSAVYLKPDTFNFKYNNKEKSNVTKREVVDEEKYPEVYRKFNDRVKGSNFDTPEPFNIGYIKSIFSTSKSKLMACVNLQIKVKKLYRPENTHKSELRFKSDINMLYWSEEGN